MSAIAQGFPTTNDSFPGDSGRPADLFRQRPHAAIASSAGAERHPPPGSSDHV